MTINYRLLIISIFLFFIGGFGPVTYIRDTFHTLLFPVQFGIRNSSTNLMEEVEFLKKIRGVKVELFELYKVKEQAISLEAQVKELKQENAVLKNQLGSGDDIDREMTMAYVIGSPFGSLNTSLTLNVGSFSGIKVGNAVSYENYLIGIVSSVSTNSCTVKLLNDPEIKISALSQNSRAKGLVMGNYGTNVLMKNILINESIALGDLIITSGEDSFIPKGLVVGKVAKINFKEEEILKSVEVELGLNPRKLEIVFVLN